MADYGTCGTSAESSTSCLLHQRRVLPLRRRSASSARMRSPTSRRRQVCLVGKTERRVPRLEPLSGLKEARGHRRPWHMPAFRTKSSARATGALDLTMAWMPWPSLGPPRHLGDLGEQDLFPVRLALLPPSVPCALAHRGASSAVNPWNRRGRSGGRFRGRFHRLLCSHFESPRA